MSYGYPGNLSPLQSNFEKKTKKNIHFPFIYTMQLLLWTNTKSYVTYIHYQLYIFNDCKPIKQNRLAIRITLLQQQIM